MKNDRSLEEEIEKKFLAKDKNKKNNRSMKVSGKGVFELKKIIIKNDKNK